MPLIKQLQIVAEPDNQMVAIGVEEYIRYIHSKLYRSGFSSLEVLKETVRNVYFGLWFKAFSPFNEILNDRILRLFDGGIIQYWTNYRLDPKSIKKVAEDIGAQILTMDHLEIGFIVCLIPITIAGFVLLIEIGIPKIKTLSENLALLSAVKGHVRDRLHL